MIASEDLPSAATLFVFIYRDLQSFWTTQNYYFHAWVSKEVKLPQGQVEITTMNHGKSEPIHSKCIWVTYPVFPWPYPSK